MANSKAAKRPFALWRLALHSDGQTRANGVQFYLRTDTQSWQVNHYIENARPAAGLGVRCRSSAEGGQNVRHVRFDLMSGRIADVAQGQLRAISDATTRLFDHLIGAGEERLGNG